MYSYFDQRKYKSTQINSTVRDFLNTTKSKEKFLGWLICITISKTWMEKPIHSTSLNGSCQFFIFVETKLLVYERHNTINIPEVFPSLKLSLSSVLKSMGDLIFVRLLLVFLAKDLSQWLRHVIRLLRWTVISLRILHCKQNNKAMT